MAVSFIEEGNRNATRKTPTGNVSGACVNEWWWMWNFGRADDWCFIVL